MIVENLSAIIKLPEYLETITFLFVVSFVLQFFIHSYLLRKKAIDRSLFFARYFPAEILGRFRDYTKKNGSPLHFLYYIQLVVASVVFIMFIPIPLSDIELSNPIVKIVIIPISITVCLMCYVTYLQLFDKYYK